MMDNRNAITTTSNISISNNSNNSNNTTNTNTTSTTKSFSSSSSSSCSSTTTTTTTTTCTNNNNITSDSNKNDHASDTFYFHSTQMQSIHETVVEQETIRERQKQSLSALRSLSYSEAENDKPANNLIIKSTSHRKQGIRNLNTPHTTRSSNRRASTEPKMKKKGKNQSMSKLVRETYSVNGHINNYGVSNPDQSRIDQFCARSATDTSTIYMQRNRLHCDAPNEKVLISREEWYQALKSVKLQFPSKVIHVKAKRDSSDTPRSRIGLEQEIEIKEEEEEVEEYDKECFENIDTKSLWDKAMIHRPLSHNEIKWLYNEGM